MAATTIHAATATIDDAPAVPKKRRVSISLVLAIAWLAGLTFLAVFADYLPFVRTYDQQISYARRYAVSPGADFWFGSDKLGRDVFARCVYGARVTLTIALASIIIGLVVGGTIGMIAGYYRGYSDRAISVGTDILLAFPALVLALVLTQQLGRGFWQVVLVLSILSIAPLARLVRAQTMAFSQREFVLAARSLGASNRRIIVRELLPNLIPTMLSVAFTGIAVLLIAEGGLAFLGFSVQVPTPTWGFMINEARPDLDDAWWATLMPCLMLFFTVLAFNIIGDWIARKFDIREAAL